MKNELVRVAILVLLLPGCRSPIFPGGVAQNDDIATKNLAGIRNDSRDLGARNSPPRTQYNDRSARGDQLAGTNPNSMSITDNLNRGNAALEQGQRLENQNRTQEANNYYQQAKPHFNQVLQADPGHLLAHHRLAFIADKQQDFSSAEYHYQQALRSKPNDANILSDLGYSYLLQGQYGRSEQYLEQALKQNPSHPQAQNNMGLLYGKQGRYHEALAMFRRTTGSDSAAQRKLNQLFPQANYQPDTAIAGRNGLPADADPAGGQSPTTDAARALHEQMRQARQQAITERNRKQALEDEALAKLSRQMGNPSGPSGPNDPAIGAQLQPSQFLQENRVPPANPLVATQVPDHQLRDSFRNVDSPPNPNRRQQYVPNDTMQNRMPPGANGFAGTGNRSPLTQQYPPTQQYNSKNNGAANSGLPNYGPPNTGSANEFATNSYPPHMQAPAMQTRPAMQNQPLSGPSNMSPHDIRQTDFAGRNRNATPNRQGFPGQSLDAETRAAAFLGMNAGPAQPFSVPNVGPTATMPTRPALNLPHQNQHSPAASIPTHVHPGSGDQINTLRYQNPPSYTPPQQWPANPTTVPRTRMTPAGSGSSSTLYPPTTSGTAIPSSNSIPTGYQTAPRRLGLADQAASPIDSTSNHYAQGMPTGATPTGVSNNGATPASYQSRNPAGDPLTDYATQLQQKEQELEQLKRQLSGQYQPADPSTLQWNDPANQQWNSPENQQWNSPANQQWNSPENQQWRSPANQRWNTSAAAQQDRQWFPQPPTGQSGS